MGGALIFEKTMTKTTGCFSDPESPCFAESGWRKSPFCPSLPSRESERQAPGKILREGCVKAKGLSEPDERRLDNAIWVVPRVKVLARLKVFCLETGLFFYPSPKRKIGGMYYGKHK